MKRIPFLVVIVALAFGAMACPRAMAAPQAANRYETAGIDDEASVGVFLRTLKTAVRHGDRKKVASLIAFPVIARVHGKSEQVKNAAQFVRWYPQIFNARVKKAVAKQNEKDLFVNWRGLMIGDGELWFGPAVKGAHLTIFAINN
jgi:hypothetical protein